MHGANWSNAIRSSVPGWVTSNQLLYLLACIALLVGFAGCRKEEQSVATTGTRLPYLPSMPYSYALPEMPEHFNAQLQQTAASILSDDPITDAGATLGRVLFYERGLSASRTISCGSCHHQEHGFADAWARSTGHTGLRTRRNSMHLVNQFYSRRQFWDLRATTLEAQVLMPIQDAVEMGLTLDEASERLRAMPYYPSLFTEAFGDDSITVDRMALALAQFVRSIVSYRTQYDVGEANGFVDYTPLEVDGKNLFYSGTTRCNQCHMTANFNNQDARNTGLDMEYTDNGRGEVTGDPEDQGKFKIPSLRNVALSAPYMHDGRFNTLEEVVEHYNSGVQQHPNLDDRLTVEGSVGGEPLRMDLSANDKQALVAFLRTLTDEPLIVDPRFSDPFQP